MVQVQPGGLTNKGKRKMPKELIDKLSRKDERFLTIAINLARSSNAGRYRHGAVVVKGGRILSTGINKVRNHPDVLSSKEEVKSESHIHAEIDAIRKVSNLDGAKIYVARLNKNGTSVGLSRPCDSCYDKIVEVGITKIIYT